jgi:quinoprotein glucose dehydrogenase
MTYRLNGNGKQYVVIAAGGHSALHNKQGDYVIAYALP